eukprot:scaffold99437_cov43-Cyclotella_meneghiniana.AAC.3
MRLAVVTLFHPWQPRQLTIIGVKSGAAGNFTAIVPYYRNPSQNPRYRGNLGNQWANLLTSAPIKVDCHGFKVLQNDRDRASQPTMNHGRHTYSALTIDPSTASGSRYPNGTIGSSYIDTLRAMPVHQQTQHCIFDRSPLIDTTCRPQRVSQFDAIVSASCNVLKDEQ